MLLTSRKADHVARPDFLDRATPPLHPPETIRTGEPSVMSFIKRAKILATRVYEFIEGGDIDTMLIRQTTLSGEPIELPFPIYGNPASIRLLASS
jgi:hypothetical protein